MIRRGVEINSLVVKVNAWKNSLVSYVYTRKKFVRLVVLLMQVRYNATQRETSNQRIKEDKNNIQRKYVHGEHGKNRWNKK